VEFKAEGVCGVARSGMIRDRARIDVGYRSDTGRVHVGYTSDFVTSKSFKETVTVFANSEINSSKA
jgi:hypothetical protein